MHRLVQYEDALEIVCYSHAGMAAAALLMPTVLSCSTMRNIVLDLCFSTEMLGLPCQSLNVLPPGGTRRLLLKAQCVLSTYFMWKLTHKVI